MEKIKNKKGFALAYGLVIMVSVLIILTSMIGYIVSQLKFSVNRAEREEALNVSEAGIYWYRWYLAHEVAGKTAEEIDAFWQGGSAYGVGDAYEHDYSDSYENVIGRYSIVVHKPATGSTIVMVESTGWTTKMPTVKRTVQVRFRRPSWSEFAVLANDFMRFGEGTDVYGKIHSNKGIRFDGVAHNVISSLVPTYDDPDHSGGSEFGVHTHVNAPPGSGVNENYRSAEAPPNAVPERSDVFIAGRQFPVPEVSFTGVTSNLSFMKTQSQKPGGTNINNCNASGCYFDNSGYGQHIILKSDGTMTVKRVTDYDKDTYDVKGRVLYQGLNTINSENNSHNYNIPDGGIIFVENNIWIEGTINNKKVTIVAANLGVGLPANVFLGINNLLYTNFNGDDIIGMIAQNNIEVIKNSQNYLTIDGALLAQSGRVGREYYTCKKWQYDTCTHWSGSNCTNWKDWSQVTPSDLTDDVQHCNSLNSSDHRNTITVNGSIATNQRYGFAYTDNTGYGTRNLNFDNNLLYYPPPYFPTGTQYSIDLWQEL